MKNYHFFLSLSIVLLLSCTSRQAPDTLGDLLEDTPAITGNRPYIASPYVTAGNRLYMVGHQDGTFPDIGWHVPGEMGGIWDHPIKLMDGFEVRLTLGPEMWPLEKADTFVNYPFANEHQYNNVTEGLSVVRRQFVPDGKEGIIVEFTFENNSEQQRNLDFSFTGHTDLRPVWLGERTGMTDGNDIPAFDDKLEAWVAKDSLNPWFVVFGADHPLKATKENTEGSVNSATSKKGSNTSSSTLTYQLNLPPEARTNIRFAIAGSFISEEDARNTYSDILENASAYLSQKKERYKILAAQSKLTTPDAALNTTFEWLKYNCDWLIRTVPGIGTGITAGIPDYPWWFGVDSEYALKGYMAVGQTEVVHQTIELLDSVSNAVNGNGRIIHEMSTNGVVFNPGNINETPQFASLIWEIYLWNGDREFLKKYFPTIKSGLDWLMQTNDSNQNLFPDGFGMMEIHGLDSEMIDVASYTQRAFDDAAKMAEVLNEGDLAAKYRQLAGSLKERINSEFWSEEFNSFADFIGTDEQALHLIADAIVRADTLKKPWAVAELKETEEKIRRNPSPSARPFVLHHNWVVNTPMEMGIADKEKGLKALQTAEQFVNPFGVFVTGIDRDASAGSDDGSFKGSKVFSYTGAVMTLPTGVQAVAENNYGRPDQALNYLQRMTRTFSYALPGSMYEVSPDYGMIVQAWNIYAFAVPIVQQFFGILPRAAERHIVIRPQMPSIWEEAKLENVKVADNAVSVMYKKTEGKTRITLQQLAAGWTMELQLPEDEMVRYEVISSSVSHQKQAGFQTFFTEEEELILDIYAQ